MVKFSQSTGWLVWQHQQSLGGKLHIDVVVTDVHTDAVFTDVQMCFGLIRSCDNTTMTATMCIYKVPVNQEGYQLQMAVRVKISVLQVYFHKYCWNMI